MTDERPDTPQREERDLVEHASRGDLSAVEDLLRRHLGGLEGFVRRRGIGLPAGKESASDIVQSVCREMLEHLRDERLDYRGEAAFRAWLYEAALLKIRNRRRYWAAERRDPRRERRAGGGAGGRGGRAGRGGRMGKGNMGSTGAGWEGHLEAPTPSPSEEIAGQP